MKKKEKYDQIFHLFQKKRYKEIVGEYEFINKNFLDDIRILNILGASLAIEKFYEKALKIFEKIEQLDPAQPNIKINLGNLYRLCGKLEKSIEYLNEEISSNLNNVSAYYNLALSYQSIGNTLLSIKNYKLAVELLSQNNQALANIICEGYFDILNELGKTKEAFEEGKSLVKRFPNSSIINWKLANLYSTRKLNSDAINLYKKAIEIDANNELIKFDLAMCLKDNGDYEESLSLLKNSKLSLSKAFYIEMLFNLGFKDDFLKELENACENFKGNRLIANISKYSSYLYNRNDTYPYCSEPFKYIQVNNVVETYLINDCIKEIDSIDLNLMNQNLLKNGTQSSGNLFSINSPVFDELKNIIEKEIKKYRENFSNENQYFTDFWPKKTDLNSWYINLKKGGSLDYHFHHDGWVSGTVYLEVPETENVIDGSIQFGFNNSNYKFIKGLPTKSYKPISGDILIFPSSLNHRVNPFNDTIDGNRRVSLAFDLIPIE